MPGEHKVHPYSRPETLCRGESCIRPFRFLSKGEVFARKRVQIVFEGFKRAIFEKSFASGGQGALWVSSWLLALRIGSSIEQRVVSCN